MFTHGAHPETWLRLHGDRVANSVAKAQTVADAEVHQRNARISAAAATVADLVAATPDPPGCCPDEACAA